MKKFYKLLLLYIILAIFFSDSLLTGSNNRLKDFPVPDNYTLKTVPAVYSEDNLFEYIDGAADLYIGYKFVKLTVYEFISNDKNSITVEVYEHKNLNNGFGIYLSERPNKNKYLRIGTEGYYEKGLLNFFKEKYYFKINAFGIKNNEEEILIKFGNKISKFFKTQIGYPKVIIGFPEKNLMKNSIKYISENFLGHSFLNSAFTAEYIINNKKHSVIIIETESNEEIIKMIDDYKIFLNKKNINIILKNGIMSFTEPYHKNRGKLFLKYRKNHIYGLFSKNEKNAYNIIYNIDGRLKKIFF